MKVVIHKLICGKNSRMLQVTDYGDTGFSFSTCGNIQVSLDVEGCRQVRSLVDNYIKEQERIEEEKKKITSVYGAEIKITPHDIGKTNFCIKGDITKFAASKSISFLLDDENRTKLIKALQEVK